MKGIYLVSKESASVIVRRTLQMVHCMSFNEFADKMYEGRRQDGYVRSKFVLMQKSFSRYYCELDFCNARKFMQIVLDKLEEEA